MPGAGYDISASTSESSTQAIGGPSGSFSVGGGIKAKDLWPIIAGLVVIAGLWFYFNAGKRR